MLFGLLRTEFLNFNNIQHSAVPFCLQYFSCMGTFFKLKCDVAGYCNCTFLQNRSPSFLPMPPQHIQPLLAAVMRQRRMCLIFQRLEEHSCCQNFLLENGSSEFVHGWMCLLQSNFIVAMETMSKRESQCACLLEVPYSHMLSHSPSADL